MLVKLAKFLAVVVGVLLAVGTLCAVRFMVLSRVVQERTGSRNVAVDIIAVIRSPWLVLGIVIILVLAAGITYRWIFQT